MVKLSWTLLSLLWAVVHPAVAQPIRPPQWVKTRELNDKRSNGVWKVFEKEDNDLQPKLPPPRASQTPSQLKSHHDDATTDHKTPSRHYKRESVSNKSIVSVLVPVAPVAPFTEPIHPEHNHAHDKQYDIYGESRHIVAMKINKSEQDYPASSSSGLQGQEDEMSSALNSSSSHSISFFSYRISFPFLKFAPVPFPQLPLPGIFMTVMVLLALVWIAIVTIGLVELGNYVWQRRMIARVANETDLSMEETPSASSGLLLKIPLDRVGLETVGAGGEVCTDDESALSSVSDSDSEPEVDDYRFY